MGKTYPWFEGGVWVEPMDGRRWRTRSTFLFRHSEALTIIVPDGTDTDFASIPRMLWPLAAPTDPYYARAALIHDTLYHNHLTPRDTADRIFYDAMIVSGTPRWQAWALWAAVRGCGQKAYRTGPARRVTASRDIHVESSEN